MDDFQQRFTRCIDLFSTARDSSGSRLALFAFAADAGGERRHHIFQDEDRPADLRSVSKVVTARVLAGPRDARHGGARRPPRH